jgi:predicted  nucleic acid-binding Zn-ribbon protein
MPWNGCKFEGDPQTTAELLGKIGGGKKYIQPTPYPWNPDASFIATEGFGVERDTNLWWGHNTNTVPFLYNGGEGDIQQNTPVGVEECGTCLRWNSPKAGGGCPISGTSDPATLYRNVAIKPCETKVINYYGEDIDPSDQASVDNFTKNGEITFRVISKVTSLASFAVAGFAKNDYRKDLEGANKKFKEGRSQFESGYAEMGQISGPAIQQATSLDALSAQLADIEKSLAISGAKIDNFISQLDTLNGTLSGQNAVLANAQSNLANARTVQDRVYWQGIVSQTRRDMLNTRREIYNVGNENVAESVIYNDIGSQGVSVSGQILALKPSVDSLKQRAQASSSKMASAQAKINEASKDTSKAQDTFGDKIETSINLAQTADGAQGVANGLQAIHAKDYYQATAEFLKMGAGQAGYYVPIGPYKQLINLCIDEIFRTAGAGGNVENFVYRFLDASLALGSQEKLGNDVSNALTMIEYGGERAEIDAWFGLAKASGDGIKIIGRWAEISAPFTGGVIAQPLIAPATQIASDSISGLIATCVAMGSRDAFFGKCTPGYRDPRSTCARTDPEGPMPTWALGMGGLYESVFNGPRKNSIEIFKGAFGQQVTEVDTVGIIKSLAQQGGDELFADAPAMRFDVSLRPTKPTNTPGMYPPGDYTGTPIYQPEEWDQKQNIIGGSE